MDTNVVVLYCNTNEISSITYIDNSLNITAGEASSPPPGISSDGAGNWTITLSADRKKSEAVAQSFDSATGGSGHEFGAQANSSSPDELNFYFGVVVTFDVGGNLCPVTLYLGQGNFGLTNNWWIGGSPISLTGGGYELVVSTPQGTYEQTYGVGATSSNRITLTKLF